MQKRSKKIPCRCKYLIDLPILWCYTWKVSKFYYLCKQITEIRKIL